VAYSCLLVSLDLFNNDFNITDYIASNDRKIKELEIM
jgi:hypothetical protein